MTQDDIIKELTSDEKMYAGIMPQGTFSSIITRIKAGTCKPQTIEWFFNSFGYTKIKVEETWQKS